MTVLKVNWDHGKKTLEVEFGYPAPDNTIGELEWVELVVIGLKVDAIETLRIKIGDELCGVIPRQFGCETSFGTSRSEDVKTPWFESCCGLITITIGEFAEGANAADFTPLGIVNLRIAPRKITVDQYEQMYQQLLLLGASLVEDLASKSERSEQIKSGGRGQSANSELQTLLNLKCKCERLMAAIKQSPVVESKVDHYRGRIEQRSRYRSNALQPSPCGRLDRFTAPIETRTLQPRQNEHSAINFLFERIKNRLKLCKQELTVAQQVLSGEVPFVRSLGQRQIVLDQIENGLNPKLQSLQVAVNQCESADLCFSTLQNQYPLRGAASAIRTLDSNVFASHPNYSPFRDVSRLLQQGSRLPLGRNSGSKVRSTSELYQSWCFLQISSSLAQLGWRPVEENGILENSLSRRVLGLTKGCFCVHTMGDSRWIVVRNEPYVLPITRAENVGSSVCVSEFQKYLTPDVLFEVYSEKSLSPESIINLTVIDAKYQPLANRNPVRVFEKYLRYHKIRSTRNPKVRAQCVCFLFPNNINRSEPTVTLSIDNVHWGDKKLLPKVEEDFEMMHSITPPNSESDWEENTLATKESIQFVFGLLALHGLGSASKA